MKFETVAPAAAIGATAAHGVRTGALTLKKGQLITAEDARRLAEAGVEHVVAVRLDPGDVAEDEAARRLAEAVAGEGVDVDRAFTGRANLFAARPGVLLVCRETVDGVNALDEAITLATLPPFKTVVAGEMVATVKIIPYAVPGATLAAALAVAGHARSRAVRVAPYRLSRIGVISTLLPGLKETVVDKTHAVLAKRLAPAGARVVAEARVAHEASDLAREIAAFARRDLDLLVVFGASAVADRRDVIPDAIERAGGRVNHFGMPVDPGNLLLLGEIEGKPVIGAPGCARSPKENGFDWVLARLLAGLPVTRADIVALGVGGLLMEIVSRPQPRAGGESAPETGDDAP